MREVRVELVQARQIRRAVAHDQLAVAPECAFTAFTTREPPTPWPGAAGVRAGAARPRRAARRRARRHGAGVPGSVMFRAGPGRARYTRPTPAGPARNTPSGIRPGLESGPARGRKRRPQCAGTAAGRSCARRPGPAPSESARAESAADRRAGRESLTWAATESLRARITMIWSELGAEPYPPDARGMNRTMV